MSETVFNKVEYRLNSLVDMIELGEIGLPDIQRPFVWKNAKVRDLFDSMYRGYPVGYLLFWKNSADDDRKIGTEEKQKHPRLVIVDGQQRLTSLYAVLKGAPIIRSNYKKEKIDIAFNPKEERFEVADAAIRRDKTFIPDVSLVWKKGIFNVAENYLSGLKQSSDVSDEETEKIHNAIQKLSKIPDFSFTTLELAENISEEDVSDIFVRINSKGTQLKQADFILTLMSVFWNEGRMKLENFCRDARIPSKKTGSPLNHFIEPDPDQLLRTSINVAFKRARLQHVYSILRGKDLETGKFSAERRDAQFSKLKKAQSLTLNIQHWNAFLNCIRTAGFRSKKGISSRTSVLFAYALYLIGRTQYNVDEGLLRQAIAQWIFMSLVTGRHTSSSETVTEMDLNRLCNVSEASQFIEKIKSTCKISLTEDFWKVTLPENLAASGANSPSLFAYNAAMVLLDAPLLFSNTRMSDFLDPSVTLEPTNRSHLFPAEYLKTLGISSTAEINQIANYAYAEEIKKTSKQTPKEYLSEIKKSFSEHAIKKMYHYHALPEDWEQMEYKGFLQKRRELMAQIIREGYETLTAEASPESDPEEPDLKSIITEGESDTVELKSTLRVNLHTGKQDKKIELMVLKTLAGFLNTSGGRLIVGITDDGTPVGIDMDGFSSKDKMHLHLVNIVKTRMGSDVMTRLHINFEDIDTEDGENYRIMVIRCEKSARPVFVKEDGGIERFYIRTGAATSEITPSQAAEYIKHRFQ